MDIEKRVQILEQEVQILKNQIQTTLLEIQERLLTSAYPTLRANDSLPNQPSVTVSTATQMVTTPSPAPAESVEESPLPVVRKVTLNDLQPQKKSLQPDADVEATQRLRSPLPTPSARRPDTNKSSARRSENNERKAISRTTPDVQTQPAANPTRATPKKPAGKTTAPARPVQAQPPAPRQISEQPAVEEPVDKNQNLVLRLIAGVGNAGAGVQWRKNRG